MMNPQGAVKVTANGVEYTLFIGMSILADVQAKHGMDILEQLEPPESATASWLPDLGVVGDLLFGALSRYHGDVADQWLVDDIVAQNRDVLAIALKGAFPEPEKAKPVGKLKKPKKAL